MQGIAFRSIGEIAARFDGPLTQPLPRKRGRGVKRRLLLRSRGPTLRNGGSAAALVEGNLSQRP